MLIRRNYKIVSQLLKTSYLICLDRMERFPIEQYEVGQRLDRYLKKSPIGWASGHKLLRKKQIVVQKKDGTIVNTIDYRLEQGDTLLISRIFKQNLGKNELDEGRAVPREQAKQILDKMIIYDNQNIAVVNKLPGYSVQGGLNPKLNLFSLMSSKYKKQLIHITHRLDRGTSGVVLFAKNKETAQLVQMSMEDKKTFSKYYLALTEGKKLIEQHGYIRSNIEWTNKNKARLCSQSEENSKDCITFYAPLESQKITTQNNKILHRNLLGIKLLTGRKHQIRCHLSDYLEQPIINDTKYGGPKNKQYTEEHPSIYLHAFGMEINKRQILDKIRLDSKCFVNEKLGSVTLRDNSVVFTANLLNYWTQYVGNDLNLEKLTSKISKLEKDAQVAAPKKRKITTIS